MSLSDANITTLHNHFLDRQDKVVELTRSLVETESPSGDEEGSRAAVSVLVAAAQAIQGLRVERLPAPNYGEHLRITAFEDASETSPIVVLGHTDTVHPRGSVPQRPWRVEDGRAYGPGVFDMKDGAGMTKMKNIPRAEAFAITLERKGGSPTPSTTHAQRNFRL